MNAATARDYWRGKRDGIDLAAGYPSGFLREYVARHPDPPSPWTSEQAHTAGFCLGIVQVIDARRDRFWRMSRKRLAIG